MPPRKRQNRRQRRRRDDKVRQLLQRPVAEETDVPVRGLDVGVDEREGVGAPGWTFIRRD